MAHQRDDFVKAPPNFAEEEYERNSSGATVTQPIRPPSPKLSSSIFNLQSGNREPLLSKVLD